MSQFLKWAAEMDRAASVAEAESDGSPQFIAIIDGNRAIAEVLRQGAALEARLESIEHVSRRRGDDLNRIRAMCTPAAQEPDIESTPDCVRRNLVALRKEVGATKAKLAALVEAAQVVLDRYGLEIEMGVDVPALRKAIAAARGGAS